MRALTHALSTGRLHHAYLFTGTRGVGKTTVSRILARALNCERGVSPVPCGECGACVAIEQGRFPDYIEMDAASNRGVDEMAQVLEQVVYAPVAGRYKVYMIDEVHMLTGHAFNAMLKTLEEPPDPVVFILATTDPKKLPATILSRCLQFNLKNLPPAVIGEHLARVLEAEQLPAEPAALALLGRAAAGSMRDALSLLDQAIAHGGGEIRESSVREMLGVVDRRDLDRILEALCAADGRALMAVADDMLAGNAPFGRTLLDLAALLQRIALAQVGVLPDPESGDDTPARWAPRISAQDLQVWYQISIHGARDLPWAPDEHAGFCMTLLRLLAFRPENEAVSGSPPAPRPVPPRSLPPPATLGVAPETRTPSRARAQAPAPKAPEAAKAGPAVVSPSQVPTTVSPTSVSASPRPAASPAPAPSSQTSEPTTPVFEGDWPALARIVVSRLGRPGLVGQFMQQSELIDHDDQGFSLRVPVKPLAEPALVGKVTEVLASVLGRPVRLRIEVGAVRGATAAQARSREQAEALAQAHAHIEGDMFIQTLLTRFDGTIVPESVQPLGPQGES